MAASEKQTFLNMLDLLEENKMRSNQLKLAVQTSGGAYSYWNPESGQYLDGRLQADPTLVKVVAKEVLMTTMHHMSDNAMINSKSWLRRAAQSGDFRDLPEWLRIRIGYLYRRIQHNKTEAATVWRQT